MEMQLGYHSATRQSWHENSMKELCVKLIEQNPKAQNDELALLKLFKDAARDDEEYLNAAIEHAVHNTFNSLQKAKKSATQLRPAPEVKAQRMAETRMAVESIKTQIIMLNDIMPNGKKMRFCTGTEMIQMGEEHAKQGVAWVKIGKRAGRKRVGEALSEGQIRAILT